MGRRASTPRLPCRGPRGPANPPRLLAFLLLGAALAAGARPLPAGVGDPISSDNFESGNFFAWEVVIGDPTLVPPLPFRMTDLDLRDPHLFVDVPIAGCSDFTDTPLPFGLGPSFNDQLATAMTTDGDGDGLLDLSLLLLLRPFEEAAVNRRLDLARGSCPPPAGATTCGLLLSPLPQTSGYDGLGAGTCLAPVAGTTSGYAPGIDEPAAPCFAGRLRESLPLGLDGITLPLQGFQIAAEWVGLPPTDLAAGLLRGFLTEADANATLLPAELPLIGGQPISILLPGGAGNCAPGDDRDVYLGATGWWIYLNYTASGVPYTGI